MLKSLPPAGNPVLLTPVEEPDKVLKATFGDSSVFLYGSGTMALAAALIAARDTFIERHSVDSPEVLLPAYACPDLVSAALFAGLKPVLVDLEAETPWMDLDRLRNQLTPNTVAVIAAHFLGIPERLTAIRATLEGSSALIIEDSAQLFPIRPSADVWEGDLVILSFGRGKPVSLLGGGAVLCRNASLIEHLPLANETLLQAANNKPRFLYKFKAHLYNALISSSLYGLLQYVPFIHLGDTVYKPLKEILPFKVERLGLLAANIAAYCMRERKQQDWISIILKKPGRDIFTDLTDICEHRVALSLLRYPVLVKDQRLRDRLFDTLSQCGLGCSRMYPKILPEVRGLERFFKTQREFPQARLFSQRLLTLPCHPGVIRDDVNSMKIVIEKMSNEKLN